MKQINRIFTLAALGCTISFLTSFKISDEYDVAFFFNGTDAEGTYALTKSGDLEEAEVLLRPRNLENGRYKISVTRKGKDIYKVDGKAIFIQTRYCYEYATGEEVFLIVESSYGYSKGKLIFP